MTWQLPDTYHLAGHGRGTATLKFYEGRDILVRREPSLIGLVAPEEIHFVEASSTCVVDDGGEQDGRGIPPEAFGKPGALIHRRAAAAGPAEDGRSLGSEGPNPKRLRDATTPRPGTYAVEDR